ncbi:MAG TPA: hypothetical protein PKY59_12075 [Pyrinomonadaceae bacterium]|nr:hypothetical protein [Pyrinomonadaceae bacterium]
MNDLERYEVTKKDLTKGRRMKLAAWTLPFALSIIPFAALFVPFLFTGSIPLFFFSFIVGIAGFVLGLILSGVIAYRYNNWTKEMRERIAADGIRAEEVDWFKNELKSTEKKALKDIQSSNLLLADAYRETLASRLTATRIVKTSKKELLSAKRRENKLKMLKSENAKNFQDEVKNDIEKISSINREAELMLAEAESRLQMIEAAAMRGGSLADSELALKKLSARSQQLPLALEEAKMHEELKKQLESELNEKDLKELNS